MLLMSWRTSHSSRSSSLVLEMGSSTITSTTTGFAMASSLQSLALYCYRQSNQDSPQFTPVLHSRYSLCCWLCVFCDCNTQVMIYGPLHAVGCSLCNLVVSHFVYWGSDSPWYDCHGHWWESKMICEESWIRNPFLHLRLLFPISDILCAWSKYVWWHWVYQEILIELVISMSFICCVVMVAHVYVLMPLFFQRCP